MEKFNNDWLPLLPENKDYNRCNILITAGKDAYFS